MAKTVLQQIYQAVKTGDVETARQFLLSHPEERDRPLGISGNWIHLAATYGQIPVATMLLELDFDINGYDEPAIQTPLLSAIGNNQFEMAVFLLSRGADPNLGRSIIRAINCRDSDLALRFVKLLVEHGVDVNRGFPFGGDDGPVFNGLSWAIANGAQEIANYLQSVGAVVNDEIAPALAAVQPANSVIDYFNTHFGPVQPLSLTEIVPTGLPISIHVIPSSAERPQVTLFTKAMSSRPMTVPPGGEDYRLAELFIELPEDWPTSIEELMSLQHGWVIRWLRNLARWPHEQQTWLGGPFATIANGDPPMPIVLGLPFTAMLAVAEKDFETTAGEKIQLYRLTPIYPEEHELEKTEGVGPLFQAFDRAGTPMVVDLHRPCAVG